MSRAGLGVGGVITVATPMPDSVEFQRPAAAESDGESVVVWTDNDRAAVQRLSAEGSLAGSAVVLDEEGWLTDVAVAYSPTDVHQPIHASGQPHGVPVAVW